MTLYEKIKKYNEDNNSIFKEIECSKGWQEFYKAIHKFHWNPHKCFINIKGPVQSIVIKRISLSNKKIKLIIAIFYEKNQNDEIILNFSENEIKTTTGMRKWIRARNIKNQKNRQKDEIALLYKLLCRYKHDSKVQKAMGRYLVCK